MNIGISELQISTNRMLKKLGLGEISLNAVAKKICFEHRSEGLKGKLIVECSDELEAETIDFFEKALNRFFECPFQVVLKNEDLSPAQELVLRWPNVLRILNGSFSYVTDKVYVKAVGERKASVYVPNEFVYRKIKKNKGLLKDAILEVINEEIEVDCEIDTTAKMAMETTHSKERSIPVEVEPLAKKAVKPVKKTASGKENTGRRIKTAPVSINSIKFDDSVYTIRGKVFSKDYREGPNVITFGLYDGTDSAKCIAFRDNALWLNTNMDDDDYLLIKGKATLDQRSSKPTFFINSATRIESPETRKDDYEGDKRIELHAHTQMSAMDSIMNIKDYIKRAAEWGWESVGVTDHCVVQAFPDLYEECRKEGINPIFGMEGSLVDITPVVYNLKRLKQSRNPLKEIDYVVFDFETTGLSPLKDEIIEFGAVKISNGEKVDEFSALVKPRKRVSAKITDITGISEEMLRNKPSIEQVLPEFMDFIKGSVLVAHNANFDYRFLKQQVKTVLNEAFHSVYVDTLALSRALLKTKRNSLDKVVKKLGLDDFNHHRALDDAEVTGKVFLKFMQMAQKRGKETLEELDSLKSEVNLKKLFGRDLTLYAKNKKGLFNLYKLVTLSHLDYFGKGVPLIPKDELTRNRDGIVIGTGSPMSELANAYRYGLDDQELKEIAQYYDFIELMPPDAYTKVNEGFNSNDLEKMYRKFYHLGGELGLPVMMTGNTHYLDPENKKPWSIMKISEKALRRRGKMFSADLFSAVNLHMRTTGEMMDIAEKVLGDRKKAEEVVIKNPKQFAADFEAIKPITRKLHPPSIEGADEEIRETALRNMNKLYGDHPPDRVKERLEKELESIIGNGYSVLYLIAEKIVKKSKEDGYLVGSRGSVGSSFVATMLGITEVNPLAPHYVCENCKHTDFPEKTGVSSGYDLPDKTCPECGSNLMKLGQEIPFETFMGFEGNKIPDIDLNFSGEYQTKAHRYIEELFGSDHVFKAGTISTVADKTAFGYVLRFEEVTDEIIKDVEKQRIANEIAGVRRTTGQHPGGLMIVPRDKSVFEFTPVQKPANDQKTDVQTTHFDYHSIHDDLVKIDALGHDDPTFMRYLQDLTGIDPLDVPMDDKATIRIFSSLDPLGIQNGDIPGVHNGSLGIPEFGTNFVRGMLMETKPSSFADLVRISGLSHGTGVWLGNARDIIVGGIATLQDVIACRDDIMNMLIHSGMDAMEAFTIMEKVRKGKGLSDEEIDDMKKHGVKKWFLNSCREIKYLFPKAHAVAYVSMAFRVAYFKVHEPLAFYSTYFTVKGGEFDVPVITSGTEKIKTWLNNPEAFGEMSKQKMNAARVVNEIALEMLMRGFEFLPVDIRKSSANSFDIEDGKLRIPLSRVQGLGDRAAESIVKARNEEPFVSVDDLKRRTSVSSSIVDVLRDMGALNNLQEHAQYSLF